MEMAHNLNKKEWKNKEINFRGKPMQNHGCFIHTFSFDYIKYFVPVSIKTEVSECNRDQTKAMTFPV